MTEPTTAEVTDPLTPAARAKKGKARGQGIESHGETWLLPAMPLSGDMDGLRDEIYDDSTVEGSISRSSLMAIGLMMLRANYRLTNEEAMKLLLAADPKALTDAIATNVLFDELPAARQTYSHWARSGLIANGLDPEKIPAELIGGVITHLLMTGRMVEPEKMTNSGGFAETRGELVGFMKQKD